VLSKVTVLPGQETLVASWSALVQLSPGARLIRSPATVAAVFPSWAPLNNAIMLNIPESEAAVAAASQVTTSYAEARVAEWAFWVPSRASNLDAPDEVREVGGLKRDTTTLVMRTNLRPGLRRHQGVVRASITAASRAAGDEPVPATDLGKPEAVSGLTAWVMIQDGYAVAGAWSFLHKGDCGIYAVGTGPEWRRRGVARTLMEHVLADAQDRGARTATCSPREWGCLSTTRSASNLQDAMRSGSPSDRGHTKRSMMAMRTTWSSHNRCRYSTSSSRNPTFMVT
jgi:ribosomal protein S18 acetylase RimI-like enzyme